jgi:hypothetical protein
MGLARLIETILPPSNKNHLFEVLYFKFHHVGEIYDYCETGLHGNGYLFNTHGLSVDAPRFTLPLAPESTLSANARAYVSFGVAILCRR